MQRGSRKNRILDYWIGIPLLNFLATVRVKGRRPREISKLGVMCSPALGDTLLFSAVLRDLRRHFGNHVEIVHFCMKQNLAAAELIPGADRRITIALTHPPATIRQFRAERLDMMLDFSSWQRLTAFYTLMSGAKFTAGFTTAGQYRGRGYDVQVAHRDDCHEVENFRSILRALDIQTDLPPEVRIPTGPDPLAEAKDLVVFHLWASGQRSWLREWPEGRWVQLARHLARPETVFAITGAPSELPRTQPFVETLRAAGLDARAFAGSDGFKSLARMLSKARLVVSVNTGVMHLAAIVGAPTLSINGPTNNVRWGPLGPLGLGVQPPGNGCGYLNLGFEYEGQATDCMERVTVDMVLDAARTLGAN